MSVLEWIPGGSLVKGVTALAGDWLEGRREDQKAKRSARLASLDMQREVVRRTTTWTRLAVLVYLFGPDLALLLPWVTPADLSEYFTALSEAQPEWRLEAKPFIVYAMWGGAEVVNGVHAGVRGRQRAKENQQAKAAQPADHSAAVGGGR